MAADPAKGMEFDPATFRMEITPEKVDFQVISSSPEADLKNGPSKISITVKALGTKGAYDTHVKISFGDSGFGLTPPEDRPIDDELTFDLDLKNARKDGRLVIHAEAVDKNGKVRRDGEETELKNDCTVEIKNAGGGGGGALAVTQINGGKPVDNSGGDVSDVLIEGEALDTVKDGTIFDSTRRWRVLFANLDYHVRDSQRATLKVSGNLEPGTYLLNLVDGKGNHAQREFEVSKGGGGSGRITVNGPAGFWTGRVRRIVLNKDGVLFLGKSENIKQYEDFVFTVRSKGPSRKVRFAPLCSGEETMNERKRLVGLVDEFRPELSIEGRPVPAGEPIEITAKELKVYVRVPLFNPHTGEPLHLEPQPRAYHIGLYAADMKDGRWPPDAENLNTKKPRGGASVAFDYTYILGVRVDEKLPSAAEVASRILADETDISSEAKFTDEYIRKELAALRNLQARFATIFKPLNEVADKKQVYLEGNRINALKIDLKSFSLPKEFGSPNEAVEKLFRKQTRMEEAIDAELKMAGLPENELKELRAREVDLQERSKKLHQLTYWLLQLNDAMRKGIADAVKSMHETLDKREPVDIKRQELSAEEAALLQKLTEAETKLRQADASVTLAAQKMAELERFDETSGLQKYAELHGAAMQQHDA